MKSTVISIKNLSKYFKIPSDYRKLLRDKIIGIFTPQKFKKFYALKNISMDIKKGEIIGIIGENGSGKSTLLKIISNIYTPSNGSVKVDGKIVSFLELGIGFNPDLSGIQNIALNGLIMGLTRDQIIQAQNNIMEFSEINKKFHHLPLKHYSTGMQMRLAFSIASFVDSDIYLFDEVLQVGDQNFQLKCNHVFLDLKKRKKTILLSSHDLISIQKIATKIALLENGRLIFFGSPKTAVEKYKKVAKKYL